MQFMVRIDVRLPGDWTEQRLAEMVEAEMARGNELMREGKQLRLWRIVGRRSNFGIWQADTFEELHEILHSMPMHPWMDIDITPIMEHPGVTRYKERHGKLPPG